MSAPREPQRPCRVINGDKLPPEAGGADALCAAIERAIAARAPRIRYSVEVRIVSNSVLAATLVADGRKLPEQRLRVSDRKLNPVSIKHFADVLAGEIAKAARPDRKAF